MRLVVITGGIACGKTTATKYLRSKYGICIVDSDAITHELQLPGQPAFKEIVRTFGDSIVAADGNLNRKMLSEIVFNDTAQRRKLNRIMHPRVAKIMIWSVIKNWLLRRHVVVLDIPLFFEVHTPAMYFTDVVTVAVDGDVQIQRLMERNQITMEVSKKKIAAQLPLEKKCEMSTTVLRNDGSVDELEKQVDVMVQGWSKATFRTLFPDPVLLLCILLPIVILVVAVIRQ